MPSRNILMQLENSCLFDEETKKNPQKLRVSPYYTRKHKTVRHINTYSAEQRKTVLILETVPWVLSDMSLKEILYST